jgi:hypothetical protein
VGLIGIPVQVIRAHKEDLKQHIQIRLRNKPAIMAEELRFDAGEKGMVNVYCAFPKGVNGSPVIELEDGEVELVLQLDGSRLSRKFKLKEMVYEGKLEI